MVGQFLHALFDVFGKLQAVFAMQALELRFRHLLLHGGLRLFRLSVFTATDRLLKTFVKIIHGSHIIEGSRIGARA